MAASYTPFSSLHLFAGLGVAEQSGTDASITQNYGGSWSPFRDGALLFNVSYNESISSDGNQRTRIVSPSLRWNIRSGWSLDVSYSFLTTTSSTEETESSNINTALRIIF
jgi:hypothetical protein